MPARIQLVTVARWLNNVLSGSYTGELKQVLAKLAPYLGIKEQAASEMVKVGKLSEAFERRLKKVALQSSRPVWSFADQRSLWQAFYDAMRGYAGSSTYQQQLTDKIWR